MRPWIQVLLAVALLSPGAWGNSPRRPFSHRTFSPDRRFVFVIIGPYSAEEEPTHWAGQWAAKVKAIRDKWTASGMYRNDGSTTPLWTVDWYAYEVDVPNRGEPRRPAMGRRGLVTGPGRPSGSIAAANCSEGTRLLTS